MFYGSTDLKDMRHSAQSRIGLGTARSETQLAEAFDEAGHDGVLREEVVGFHRKVDRL